jgi:hypothetical protein
MAASMNESGDLNWCGYCGSPLNLVDGTDPEESDDHFEERYECENGHVGHYEWDSRSGKVSQKFTGACRE